jgi:rubrerythrin
VSKDARTREETVRGNADGFVEFHATGERAHGGFRCSSCGYGVAVSTVLPRCPMCSGESWEADAWRSFGRFSAEI